MAHSKQCFKCNETKPLTDFYAHPTCVDGRVGKCKVCNKADVAAWRLKNIDRIRAFDRGRAKNPERVRACAHYRKVIREGRKAAKAKENRAKKTQHPLYLRHSAMLRRCRNANCDAYPYYGGRGISVCDRWTDFFAFVSDMGMPGDMNMQIDRIDPDGNYTLENCRWATRSENCLNRRKKGATSTLNKPTYQQEGDRHE